MLRPFRGIDSAIVACVAAEALGAENILALLMPSRFSSEGSLTDAYALAKTLHIKTKELSIETLFSSYLDLLQPHWEEKGADVTEENLQARIRGMLLMAFSNKMGYTLLATGNKSELAMGYCTLYGDMCGAIAPIGDLTKTEVYNLAKWINRDKEIIPKSSIEKPPSAELRANQKDSDTLPDYAILDTIVKDYVEDYVSAEEISKRHNLPEELVKDVIRRINIERIQKKTRGACLENQ